MGALRFKENTRSYKNYDVIFNREKALVEKLEAMVPRLEKITGLEVTLLESQKSVFSKYIEFYDDKSGDYYKIRISDHTDYYPDTSDYKIWINGKRWCDVKKEIMEAVKTEVMSFAMGVLA